MKHTGHCWKFIGRPLATHVTPWLLTLISFGSAGAAQPLVPDASENTPSVSGRAAGSDFVFGIGTAKRWGADAISYAKRLGVSSVRTDAVWRDMETRRGVFEVPDSLEQWVDGAVAEGLAPVLILDYGNPLYSSDKPKTPQEVDAFKRYAVFVLNHFKGRVKTYELWNEWNNTVGGTTPGDPQSYIAFARQILPALRTADPSAKILSVGVSPGGLRGGWLNHFLELKGHLGFDGVALHPYSWPWKTDRSPEAAMRLVDGYQDAAKRANGGKPVDFYVTEMNWATFKGELGESGDAAAAYLARFVLLAACRPYIRGVWWFTLFDDGSNLSKVEDNYGVYDAQRRLKPAGAAIQRTAQLLGGSTGGCEIRNTGDDVSIRLPKKGGGGAAVISWEGGVIAPGGAALQTRAAIGDESASGASRSGRHPLFQTTNGKNAGVPSVEE